MQYKDPTILEVPKRLIDQHYVILQPRSTYFDTLELWKVRPGRKYYSGISELRALPFAAFPDRPFPSFRAPKSVVRLQATTF